jgi:hypothetical protein
MIALPPRSVPSMFGASIMTRRSSCGCVWQRTDPDSYDGECAVGDTCECDLFDHHPCGCGRVPEQCDECGGAK